MNDFGKSIQEWWDSDAFKELQKSHEEGVQKAVEKYHALPEEDKLDMIQAILHIMCESEQKGCSHRGLMSELGVYPSAFWISELMDVHNSLWGYYHDKKQEKEFKSDLDAFDDL